MSIYLSIHPSIYLSVCLSIYLSICKLENLAILRDFFIFQSWQHQKRSNSAWRPHFFKVDNIKNEAILRGFLIFRSWQHQKRSNSARLLHFLNLTTSKTKQFWETSSIFELDNIKNQAILRDFLQKWKVECRADGLVPMRFAIFPFHLPKVLRLPRKSDARSYEVLHLSRKIILANLKIWCSKMQPLSGNQRPDLLTSLMNMSFVLRLPRDMHFWKCPTPAIVFGNATKPSHFVLTFDKVHNPLRLPSETSSERPKVVRTWCALYILTSKCASHHNGVHFFDISTSKKWSEPGVFCTFWLRNVLRAAMACTFSTSQLPKSAGVFCTFWLRNVLRATMACNFSSLIFPDGSAPATLASLLFDPPEPQIMGKTQCFATFLPFRSFSRICIFFLLTLSLLWSSLFYSSLLSGSSHLCFSSVRIVGSLTSKLPSINSCFKRWGPILFEPFLNLVEHPCYSFFPILSRMPIAFDQMGLDGSFFLVETWYIYECNSYWCNLDFLIFIENNHGVNCLTPYEPVGTVSAWPI